MEKIIKLKEKELDILENFTERMKKVSESDFRESKNIVCLKYKNDDNMVNIKASQSVGEECTNHFINQIRCFILSGGSREIKNTLDNIVDQMNIADKKEKSEILNNACNKAIEISKKESFELYMYGKYAKSDFDKSKRIKNLGSGNVYGELSFHEDLKELFFHLNNILYVYFFAKENYKFDVEKDKKSKNFDEITFNL